MPPMIFKESLANLNSLCDRCNGRVDTYLKEEETTVHCIHLLNKDHVIYTTFLSKTFFMSAFFFQYSRKLVNVGVGLAGGLCNTTGKQMKKMFL